MFIRLWQFRTSPEQAARFRTVYGPGGPWASLFGNEPGFLGTELLESATDPTTFLTLDRWASREAWEAFRARWSEEYGALDRECEDLTISELEIGSFQVLPS